MLVNRKLVLTIGLLFLFYASLGGLAYLATDFAPNYQRFSLAISLCTTLMHLSAFGFIVRGFKYFKRELRVAYTHLGIGFAILGLTTSQLAVVNLFGWAFWISSGGVLIPYIISVTQIQRGVTRFARSLGITTKKLSLPRIVLGAALLGTVIAVLPHADTTLPERTIRAGIWMTTFITVFFTVSAYGLHLASKKVGNSYIASLKCMRAALLAAAFSAVVYIGNLLFTGGMGWFMDWNITIIFINVSGFLFMTSGYLFSVIGEPATAKAGHKATSIDIILYAEGLATNLEAVDPIVDDLRVITSQMHDQNDTNFSSEDQQKLYQTYCRLENYLTTQDPLRKLTVDEVRNSVEHSLAVSADSHDTFWPQVRTAV